MKLYKVKEREREGGSGWVGGWRGGKGTERENGYVFIDIGCFERIKKWEKNDRRKRSKCRDVSIPVDEKEKQATLPLNKFGCLFFLFIFFVYYSSRPRLKKRLMHIHTHMQKTQRHTHVNWWWCRLSCRPSSGLFTSLLASVLACGTCVCVCVCVCVCMYVCGSTSNDGGAK